MYNINECKPIIKLLSQIQIKYNTYNTIYIDIRTSVIVYSNLIHNLYAAPSIIKTIISMFSTKDNDYINNNNNNTNRAHKNF
jgi:hypothetical protein